MKQARLGVVIALSMASVLTVVPGVEASPTSTTYVTMISDGEYIGAGTSQMFYPGNGTVTMGGDSGYATVDVSGGTLSKSFRFDIAAPPGETLAIGAYEDAERAPFRNAGHPGLDIHGDGRGCNAVSGRFDVHDIATSGGVITKLWLTYEQHCEGGVRALIGEVRYAVPGGDSDVLVAGGKVSWPELYPGVHGVTVPIWFANTGSAPFQVNGTSLSGTNPSDFSVLSNGCSSAIAPGSICAVFTRFTPTAPGARSATLTFFDSSPATTHSTSLSGRGVAGFTRFSLRSEPGDYIGQGQSYDYDPSNATIDAGGTTNAFGMNIDAGALGWNAVLKAPAGQILSPGTYTGAKRYSFAGDAAGLEVTGNGRGCNTITGQFTVIEAVFENGTGPMQKFSATFEQHCEGGAPALRGWIAWKATEDNVPPPPTPAPDLPPGPVTDVDAYTMTGSAILTWSNPADADFSHVVVRGAESLTPPATVSSGDQVYSGPDEGAFVDFLTPGQSYAFSIWAYDLTNHVSTRAQIILRGTNLALTQSTGTITYGVWSRITGKLVDATTGAGLAGELIDVYAKTRGTNKYSYVDTIETGADGGVSYSLMPTRSTDVWMTYHGEMPYLGSPGEVAHFIVRMKISATLSPTTVARNGYATIKGVAYPNHGGWTIYLQRYYSGGWRTVSSRTLNSSSAASWTLHPTSRGTFKYRLYMPSHSDHASATSRTLTLTVT